MRQTGDCEATVYELKCITAGKGVKYQMSKAKQTTNEFWQREEIVSEMAQSHKTVVPMAGSVVFGILLCNEHARKCLFKIICIWKKCNLIFFIQAYRLFHLGW